MKKTIAIPNPFAYFMDLTPKVKISIIGGLVLIIMTLIIVAGMTGNLDILLQYLFDGNEAKK